MSWIALISLGFGVPGFVAGIILLQEPWLGLEPGLLLIFALLGFAVGSVVGEGRGKTWLGSWLGLILGPFGWLIVRLLPGTEARAR